MVRASINPQPPALPDKDHEYHVYALTRKASSPSAQHLAEQGANITVVEGDLDVPESISRIFEEARAEGGHLGCICGPGISWIRSERGRRGTAVKDIVYQFSMIRTGNGMLIGC